MSKPESKALEFIYQDVQIHFLLSQGDNVMVNATEMAQLFNQETRYFLRLDSTKNFAKAMLREKFNRADYSNFDPFFGKKKQNNSDNRAELHDYIKENIYYSQKKGGTYLCSELALKFAAWLDPDFDLWVQRTIYSILFSEYYMIHKKKVIEIEETKNKIEQLKFKIRNKIATENTAIELLDLQDLLLKLMNEKRNAINSQVRNIQYSFFED
jgi:hypothetical protein